MRCMTLIGTLALVIALTSPAHAGWYVKMHGTTDSLTWQSADGHALDLSSKEGKGVRIVKIAPDGRDGLHKGDLITAVDGHVVAHVADLLTYANAHLQDPAKLSVSHGGHDVNVTLAAGELGALVHPHP